MEEYVGKVCPFCQTEITAGAEVKVCPVCGIPHHKECWNENKGCTTFGCSEQNYEEDGVNANEDSPAEAGLAELNVTETCAKCGALLESKQEFCTKCGTAKNALGKRVCSKCGVELQDEQDFCHKCGQKVGVELDNSLGNAINKFNENVSKKKQKTKRKPIIIAIVLVVCLIVGIVAANMIAEKKAKEAKQEYIRNVRKYLELSLDVGVNLEDIADTVQKYWYEHIWDDKHGSDINDAVAYAMIAKSSEIAQAKADKETLNSLYSKIKNIPDNIADEDMYEIKELRDAVKDLHNIYTDFYELATDPTGSYDSYSENNKELTKEYLSCYNALENLLD